MTTIPTIQQIFDNLIAAYEAEFNISVNDEGNSWIVADCATMAGELYLFYLTQGDIQRNIWFDTADSEAQGGTLERYGRTILGRDPFAAVKGQYTADATGSIGGVIPLTMVFMADNSSSSPGKLYQVSAGYTLAGTTEAIVINALDGGLDSRLQVGDTLTATAPMVNVDSVITITVEDVVPVDAETIEEYRENIKEKVLLTPGSWSAVDYRLVGVNVTGVGQVYAYASSGGSGEVDVYLQGTTPVASPGPSVSPTVLSDYETALEAVLPLAVWQVNYAASTIRDVAITITMGTFPALTATQQADIQTALQDFVNGVHPFIAAADDVADRNDVLATYNLTATAAAAVPGYGFSGLTFTVAGVSQTFWRADNGEIPFLLTPITFA